VMGRAVVRVVVHRTMVVAWMRDGVVMGVVVVVGVGRVVVSGRRKVVGGHVGQRTTAARAAAWPSAVIILQHKFKYYIIFSSIKEIKYIAGLIQKQSREMFLITLVWVERNLKPKIMSCWI